MNDRSEESDTHVEYRGTGFYVSVALIIITAAILLVFAVQNAHEVEINFLAFDATVPLFAVVIGAALATVVLDQLIGLVWRRHKRHRLEEKKELEELRRRTRSTSDDGETGTDSRSEDEQQDQTAV